MTEAQIQAGSDNLRRFLVQDPIAHAAALAAAADIADPQAAAVAYEREYSRVWVERHPQEHAWARACAQVAHNWATS